MFGVVGVLYVAKVEQLPEPPYPALVEDAALWVAPVIKGILEALRRFVGIYNIKQVAFGTLYTGAVYGVL